MFVDNLRDSGVLVALAVNHMAPVAPHRSNIQQDGFVLAFGAREGVFAPFVPINRLMRRRTQIRAGGILQAVFGHLDMLAAWKNYCTCEPGPGSRGSSGLRPA